MDISIYIYIYIYIYLYTYTYVHIYLLAIIHVQFVHNKLTNIYTITKSQYIKGYINAKACTNRRDY